MPDPPEYVVYTDSELDMVQSQYFELLRNGKGSQSKMSKELFCRLIRNTVTSMVAILRASGSGQEQMYPSKSELRAVAEKIVDYYPMLRDSSDMPYLLPQPRHHALEQLLLLHSLLSQPRHALELPLLLLPQHHHHALELLPQPRHHALELLLPLPLPLLPQPRHHALELLPQSHPQRSATNEAGHANALLRHLVNHQSVQLNSGTICQRRMFLSAPSALLVLSWISTERQAAVRSEKDVTPNELFNWMAMVLYLGLVKVSEIRDLWSMESAFSFPFPPKGDGSIAMLFCHLHHSKFGACGTVRERRLGFPQTQANALPKSAVRGDMQWIREGPLLYVKWKDTHDVTMCSTIHKAYRGETTKRRSRKDGVWTTQAIPVPSAVKQYNKYMGGVELSDALIKYYTVDRKTSRWYMKLFLHLIDISVVNSFILHKEMAEAKGEKPMKQKRFRIILLEQLGSVGKVEASASREAAVGGHCLPAREAVLAGPCVPVLQRSGQESHTGAEEVRPLPEMHYL
ncbi:hypothetical protein ACEWY4_027928 [Coilia grayii]|uniref:PiggyBac transposable element-derived protein domain-containing protein n=1 Tax=Coilia grayii TaxID=363190 RepID=A0ABD1IPC4_9TELE